MWARARDDRGQALLELALGLPLFMLAALYAFALIDATATQEAVEAGARRAASVLAGSNDDAQAAGAVGATGWLRGQSLGITFRPDGAAVRCPGTAVTIAVSAPGHLGFLLLAPRAWTARTATTIESAGPRAGACPP